MKVSRATVKKLESISKLGAAIVGIHRPLFSFSSIVRKNRFVIYVEEGRMVSFSLVPFVEAFLCRSRSIVRGIVKRVGLGMAEEMVDYFCFEKKFDKKKRKFRVNKLLINRRKNLTVRSFFFFLSSFFSEPWRD